MDMTVTINIPRFTVNMPSVRRTSEQDHPMERFTPLQQAIIRGITLATVRRYTGLPAIALPHFPATAGLLGADSSFLMGADGTILQGVDNG